MGTYDDVVAHLLEKDSKISMRVHEIEVKVDKLLEPTDDHIRWQNESIKLHENLISDIKIHENNQRYENAMLHNNLSAMINDAKKSLEERMEKLEKWQQAAINKNVQDMRRIKDLEKVMAHLGHPFFIEKDFNSKNPKLCGSCEGRGIVWG